MSAFDNGILAMFRDPHLSKAVTYTTVATGVSREIRAVITAADAEARWGATALSTDSVVIDVTVADVALPVIGDLIEWAGEARVVQGVPERDVERLTWSLDTAPR